MRETARADAVFRRELLYQCPEAFFTVGGAFLQVDIDAGVGKRVEDLAKRWDGYALSAKGKRRAAIGGEV